MIIINDFDYSELRLRFLRSVARTCLAAFLKSGRIKLAAHDGVQHADVLHAASTQKNDRVLLKVVAFAGNIGRHFHAVREPHAGYLADGGIRLSRGLRGHLGAYAALERRRIVGRAVLKRVEAARKSEDLGFPRFVLSTSLRELVDGGHVEKEDPSVGRRHYIR